jgi:hypothetical protein
MRQLDLDDDLIARINCVSAICGSDPVDTLVSDFLDELAAFSPGSESSKPSGMAESAADLSQAVAPRNREYPFPKDCFQSMEFGELSC